jgi:hypothetical protein
MNYTFSKKIGLSLIVAVVAFFFAQMAFAQQWTAPTAQFPNDNTPAPIHTGSVTQGKTGLGFAASFPSAIRMDDVFSRYSTYSEDLVAAPRFCLTATFADYTAALNGDMTNCITSWSGGQGGDLPAGTDTQTLRHNGTEWVANSILQNDGVTVTVKRGAGMPSIGGTGGIDFGGISGFDPDGTGGGTVIDGGDFEEIDTDLSGFNYIKELFSANKAFAQNGGSTAPIFRAIKDGNPQLGGGYYGLEVLYNGVTRAKGGFISQGDATVTGDATLQDRTVAHRITIADQGTTNVPGGVLEAWDGEFQWNGAGGEFNVGSPAQISGPLRISSGDPADGRVLTSDAQGNTSWSNISSSGPEVIRVEGNTENHNADNSYSTATCPETHPIVIGGGGTCSNDVAFLNDTYPLDTSPGAWRASCSDAAVLGSGDNDVIAYALCMSPGSIELGQSSGSTPPPSGPEWTGWYSNASLEGSEGQSCLAYINSLNTGFPNITDPNNFGHGGNPNSFSAPINVGNCPYAVMGAPSTYGLYPADVSPGSNYVPFFLGPVGIWSRN